ncbi:TRAP-type C4-dicarboxylate transport system, substrate-binding protein [Loktanella atrilutea]|uniref:TRAP-type C4-dicarboxylate transport system, substrate-binding protein n=1 Tax=Loktanella atrilutea TaxID=366533 RepID=A0A1M5C7G5_LOKAT|nr:TRAP transporter substrate-binding protein [Loktanella atrilutea]SHF50651.1 TRAP-type C4-dicarboxylate transport system, substrate-binding protein [Loktanella atrilutea]
MKSTALASALALIATTAGTAALAETWNMPTAYPADNYHTENAQTFADEVKTCSNGELEIVLHPGGSLFKGDEIKRAVQLGEAEIGERLLSAHANEDPIFAYDSVPFLATSFDASEKLRAAAVPTLTKVMADQNLTLLYSVPWPPQGLYLNKEANSLSDLSGVKFRAYNATTARVAELAGMVPTQIEAAELKQALATGVVESMISSGSTGVDESVWEDVSNFYDVKAWLPRNTIFANADAFDALSPEVQTCVTTAAEAARTRGAEKAAELSDGFVKTLADNGMTVSEPGEQLSADLKGIGDTMTAEWLDQTGEDGKAILDAYGAN